MSEPSAKGTIPAAVKAAYDYINALYKNEKEETASTYTRPVKVTIDEVVFPITWTAESTPAGAVTVGSNGAGYQW